MTDTLKWLKRAALFEGTSLIVLIFIGLPLKYWLAVPIAIKIIGPVHGGLF